MHKEGVAASMLYASARFTAWLMASSFPDSKPMQEAKAGALDFYRAVSRHAQPKYRRLYCQF